MNCTRAGILGLLAAALLVLPGCGFSKSKDVIDTNPELHYYQTAATRVAYTDVLPPSEMAASTPAPLTLLDDTPEFRDISLQECVQLALQNNKVMRDLGVAVLRTPGAVKTVHEPAIQETEPRLGLGLVGPEAALSAFDASFAANAFVEKVERADNNGTLIEPGDGPAPFKQDLGTMQAELSKIAATGTRFTARNVTEYDANNATLNTFGSSWAVRYELEARHPLLQGGGIDFNRIAGPGAVPGIYTGILLARINTDIALADFELSVRNMVNDVENAYLDLYYAYRDLDSKIAARDAALETWRNVNALFEADRKGGEAFREAQAREQYFRFQEEVQNSLNGRLVDATRGNNGSSGGTFRAVGGVQVAERRLRVLVGLPVTDGALLRPAEEPEMAEVVFDWEEVLQEALSRRVELRRQKWNVKSRELELVAARNFLLPRLDVVGRYTWRGFGRDLFRQHEEAAASRDLTLARDSFLSRQANSRFNNAYDNLFNGDFQGWQLGAELSLPLGFRRGHAAVSNAEFRLAREVAVLRQQEQEVALDLSNAIADLRRSYSVVETNYNRRLAAKQQLVAVQAAYDAEQAGAELDEVLDAQRRLADAETNYYRALVEYASSTKNVHFEKGSLLDYNGIYLEEGPWPHKAYHDAARKEDLRSRVFPFNFLVQPGPVISSGPSPQLVLPLPDGGLTEGMIGNQPAPPANTESIDPGEQGTPQTPPAPTDGPPKSEPGYEEKTTAGPFPPINGSYAPTAGFESVNLNSNPSVPEPIGYPSNPQPAPPQQADAQSRLFELIPASPN